MNWEPCTLDFKSNHKENVYCRAYCLFYRKWENKRLSFSKENEWSPFSEIIHTVEGKKGVKQVTLI